MSFISDLLKEFARSSPNARVVTNASEEISPDGSIREEFTQSVVPGASVQVTRTGTRTVEQYTTQTPILARAGDNFVPATKVRQGIITTTTESLSATAAAPAGDVIHTPTVVGSLFVGTTEAFQALLRHQRGEEQLPPQSTTPHQLPEPQH